MKKEPTDSHAPRWKQDLDSIPQEIQKMLAPLADVIMTSFRDNTAHWLEGRPEFAITFGKRESLQAFCEAFLWLQSLAEASTAPWPQVQPPERIPITNLVELAADVSGSDCAFDQVCAHGHRVEGHAVYCHNEAWLNHPRKCRRRQHRESWDKADYRHEECPGFYPNHPDRIAK